MRNWLKRMFGTGENLAEGETTERPELKEAPWLEADSPNNPFGVRLVDLMQNLHLTSCSKSQNEAETSTSWRPGHQHRLIADESGTAINCDLRYPIGAHLPEGMLYLPQAMEDKWVIAWRDNKVIFARSWTGRTEITADAYLEDGKLCLSRLYAKNDSLSAFGDLPTVVDWMVRSHAMEERLALPVDEESADMLHKTPLAGMHIFGHRLFCAGIGHEIPAPKRLLYSDGELAAAVYENDAQTIRRLASDEAWQTPTRHEGCPPLVLAALLGHYDLCQLIIELGSDVEVKDANGGTALQASIVNRGGPEIAHIFMNAGANPDSANNDGFTSVHGAAEIDDADMIRFLADKGADLEAQTNLGYRPIHITAGLGHATSAYALAECGADVKAQGDGRTPEQIARDEGHEKLARWFRAIQ